jgi:hypothetical protein
MGPSLAQSPPDVGNPLDPTRFPRVAQFIKDPTVETALRAFAAAIPWARDPDGRGVRADDELYLRAIADWTEEILRTHADGCSHYIYSTGATAGPDIETTPSWFALDELIRCNRPEGAEYRALLQRATVQVSRTGSSTPFVKTGWYDNGRVQSWVFVFWSVGDAGGLADLDKGSSASAHRGGAAGD